MAAELAVVADVEARDHCLVVIKGTFTADESGALRLADEQLPPTTCDEHEGDPEQSPVRFEQDFVLHKPGTDVLVVGNAVAPDGVPVASLPVRLELPGRSKDALVFGERRWVRSLATLIPSKPVPFVEMPLSFARAHGGSGDTHNPLGVGRAAREGEPVPNIERPNAILRSGRDKPTPIGFGVIGRSWAPRRHLAGTYDQHWRDEHAPYLPPDFDLRFNHCAPEDQQLPPLQGGEVMRCFNMSRIPVVTYVMPSPLLTVRFRSVAADSLRQARLDTIILEPHLCRAQLVWRCAVPLSKRPSDLREVMIGDDSRDRPIGARAGKPKFRSLDAAMRATQIRQKRHT